MGRIKAAALMVMIASALALTVGGCATAPEPFEYRPDNELKKGPGLFSGEDGAFTIYRESADTGEPDSAESGGNPQ